MARLLRKVATEGHDRSLAALGTLVGITMSSGKWERESGTSNELVKRQANEIISNCNGVVRWAVLDFRTSGL